MVASLLKKVIGTSNDRFLRSLRPLIQRINDLEKEIKPLSDEELSNQTLKFKARLEAGETLDSLLPEAFATVREAAWRSLGMRHFDVQLIGGMVLHRGMIAEMRTGEGKTLVATLAAYLNALEGKGVHVVTVNDYLARRDSEWMSKVYNFLGLSCGVVYSGLDENVKREAYRSDITYGQNNEFGFDYLRDNMKYSPEALLQRGHHFAIVDEVDSILIDEARTPLIISGPAEDSSELYFSVNKIIPFLQDEEHFEIDLRSKNPTLNEAGIARCEELLHVENLYDPENIELIHHVNQALRAHRTMERDKDYVVMDGRVIIVDDFTGRLMPGRRWSDGLHQAVEAKEGLSIAAENQTLASITFQNLFRLYNKLSGMTGTAATEAQEFKEIYKLDVVVIPTNRPMVRIDDSDVVFRTRTDKYEALADDVEVIHETGQPILIGTISIEQSEAISRLLQKRGVPHEVLNAKAHEREADIVAQAGRLNSVTIATNMAGRGTDIVLGGNPEGLAEIELGKVDEDDSEYQAVLARYKAECEQQREQVKELGGLCIMGTERHESRRIDNQLRGRAGRQGDPGLSRFYVSLEDDLMKRFGGERMQSLMKTLGWEEGAALDGRMISRSVESAQRKVERFHFENRKHVTEYDDVMNKQRQVIYNLRNRVLRREGLEDEIISMMDDLLENLVLGSVLERKKKVDLDFEKIGEGYQFLTNMVCPIQKNGTADAQHIFDKLREEIRVAYLARKERHEEVLRELREKFQGELVGNQHHAFPIEQFDFTTFEQDTILERLDHFWNLHLREMDQLREGIGLRGYAQKNPLHEYQREGFMLFSRMLDAMKESVVRKLFFAELNVELLTESFEAERARRAELMDQIEAQHDSVLDTDSSESSSSSKREARDPDEQKAKLEAQRKERRKQRRKAKR